MGNVWHSFITGATITAVMLFIVFMLFGSGGGFVLIYTLGQYASKIPIWIWGVIAGAWILKSIMGK
jgi:hypothetical protein